MMAEKKKYTGLSSFSKESDQPKEVESAASKAKN
jgi:hypothetical protein